MHNGLVENLSDSIKETILQRIKETEDLIREAKNKGTYSYVKVLIGLAYDYEQVSDYEKAEKTARECLDILYEGKIKGNSPNEVNKLILSCYDTLARCGDFESFLIAMEWNRPIEKQFYLPRRKILKRYGLIQAFQDVVDGKLDFLCINMPPRTGKLLSDDTPVLTRHGWKCHGALEVGDEVLNHKGEFVKIQKVFPKDFANYKVSFSNGEEILCHENHEWLVYDRHAQKEKVVETKYMIDKVRDNYVNDNKNHYRFLIPQKEPLNGEYAFLPVDPYTFGAWLGDGTNTNPYLSGDKKDSIIAETIQRNGYKIRHTWVHNTTGVYTYDFEDLREALQCLGLCHSRYRVPKYIPAQYLTANINQRLELLAGLLDTDGTLRKKEHRYTFTTSEETLKNDFVSLVNTFGWRTTVVKCEPKLSTSGIQGVHEYWTISFNPTMEIPCKLERKQLKEFSKPRRISIEKIEKLDTPVQGNCIQVEGGIYLVGKQLVPTHNSTTGIFFCVFMACLYPDRSILGNGHSASLTQSFYNEVVNICTSEEYRMHDIFPTIKMVNKSAEYSYIDFNYEKRFHTMMFRSVDGGTTGLAEASNLLYCDDLVKDVETANNPDRLEKLFYTYTSTIQDRKVQRKGKDGAYRPCPEVHINTPWSIHDVTSRLIQIYGDDGKNPRVRIISVPCYDNNGDSNFKYDYGKGFDVSYYKQLEASEDPVIFSAKYLMKPVERDGLVFNKDNINFYNELPSDTPDRVVAYADVAHGGADYFSMPIAYVYGNEVFIEKVLFKHDFGGDDYIRPFIKNLIIKNKVQRVGIEKNNGGDFFATLMEQDLKDSGYRCNITTHNAPTTKSKLDRILACQNEIKGIATENNTYRLYFKNPDLIKDDRDYLDALQNLYNWNQNPKMQTKQHDDFPDSLAGLIMNVLNGTYGGKARSVNAIDYL